MIAIMDRFGVYLANLTDKDGKPRARNTVGQYFRQTKMWMYSRFPQYTQLVDAALLSKARTLERYSSMRPGGKLSKQAPPCRKQDLYSLVNYLYSAAHVASDIQDAALVALLWYLFGRASDLATLHKPSIAVCGENVIFIRFMRVKTSEEHGLTLFPDVSTLTCPITALAAALVLQTTPSSMLLPHVPQPSASDFEQQGPLIPLASILSWDTLGRSLLDEATRDEEEDGAAKQRTKTTGVTPGIHAYVNRVLGRISSHVPAVARPSSHSFRRGAAQHANGTAGISPQWIADRGSWQMSSASKLFLYIFNSTEEDQKVAKTVSGYDVDTKPRTLDLTLFDTATRARIDPFKAHLFSSCSGLQNPQLNVSPIVIDILCAYLIKAVPLWRSLNSSSPLIARVDQAMASAGIEHDELISWSLHLSKAQATEVANETPNAKHVEMIEHQAAAIDQLIDLHKAMAGRLLEVESKLRIADSTAIPDIQARMSEDQPVAPKPKRRKRQNTNLWETWYQWFAGRAYATETDKQWKSTMRRCVAYMLLFADALEFDETADNFREIVLAAGHEQAAKVVAFLGARGVSATSTGTVERKLRALHKAGELDDLILAFCARVQARLLSDPTPPLERATLDPVAQ